MDVVCKTRTRPPCAWVLGYSRRWCITCCFCWYVVWWVVVITSSIVVVDRSPCSRMRCSWVTSGRPWQKGGSCRIVVDGMSNRKGVWEEVLSSLGRTPPSPSQTYS